MKIMKVFLKKNNPPITLIILCSEADMFDMLIHILSQEYITIMMHNLLSLVWYNMAS